MNGFLEGGEFERGKGRIPDAKKQYMHLKPFVTRKLWKRHEKTMEEAKRRIYYEDEVYRKMRP